MKKYSPKDFKAASVVELLKDSENRVTQLFFRQLSVSRRQVFNDLLADGPENSLIASEFCEELNTIIESDNLFYDKSITGLISNQTEKAINFYERNISKSNARRVNRRIFEDIFDDAIVQHKISDRSYRRGSDKLADCVTVEDVMHHLLEAAEQLGFTRIRYYHLNDAGNRLVSAGSAGHVDEVSKALAEGLIVKYLSLYPRETHDAFKCIPPKGEADKNTRPEIFYFDENVTKIQIVTPHPTKIKVWRVPAKDCEPLLREKKSNVWLNIPLVVAKRCIGKLSCDWGDMPFDIDPLDAKTVRELGKIANFSAPYLECMHHNQKHSIVSTALSEEVPQIGDCKTLLDLFEYCTVTLPSQLESDHGTIFTLSKDHFGFEKLILRKTSYVSSQPSENCRSYLLDEPGLTPWVAKTKIAIRLQDLDDPEKTKLDIANYAPGAVRADRIRDSDKHGRLLAVPIKDDAGSVLGVLRIIRSGGTSRLFTEEEKRFVEYIADKHIAPKLKQLPWATYEVESRRNRDTLNKILLNVGIEEADSVAEELLEEFYGIGNERFSPLIGIGQMQQNESGLLEILENFLDENVPLSRYLMSRASTDEMVLFRAAMNETLSKDEADRVLASGIRILNSFITEHAPWTDQWVDGVTLRKMTSDLLKAPRVDQGQKLRRRVLEDVYRGKITRIGNLFMINVLDIHKTQFVHRIVGGPLYEDELKLLREKRYSLPGTLTELAVNTLDRRIFVNDIKRAVGKNKLHENVRQVWSDANCAAASRIADQKGENYGAILILSSHYRLQDMSKGQLLEELASRIADLFSRQKSGLLQFALGGIRHDMGRQLQGMSVELNRLAAIRKDRKVVMEDKIEFFEAIVESYCTQNWEDILPFNIFEQVRLARVGAQNEWDPGKKIHFLEGGVDKNLKVRALSSPIVAILYNLFKNSIAELREAEKMEDGKIWVRAAIKDSDEGQWLVFEIEDNGRGLPQRMKERVEFPDLLISGRYSNTPSTGRGVPLVIQLLERYKVDGRKGKLQYVQKEGAGCCFGVWFPIVYNSTDPLDFTDVNQN